MLEVMRCGPPDIQRSRCWEHCCCVSLTCLFKTCTNICVNWFTETFDASYCWYFNTNTQKPHKLSSFSFHFLDGSASFRVMVGKHAHVNINQNVGVYDCWETTHFLFTFPHWHFTFPSLVHLHKYTHTSTHLHYRREGRWGIGGLFELRAGATVQQIAPSSL